MTIRVIHKPDGFADPEDQAHQQAAPEQTRVVGGTVSYTHGGSADAQVGGVTRHQGTMPDQSDSGSIAATYSATYGKPSVVVSGMRTGVEVAERMGLIHKDSTGRCVDSKPANEQAEALKQRSAYLERMQRRGLDGVPGAVHPGFTLAPVEPLEFPIGGRLVRLIRSDIAKHAAHAVPAAAGPVAGVVALSSVHATAMPSIPYGDRWPRIFAWRASAFDLREDEALELTAHKYGTVRVGPYVGDVEAWRAATAARMGAAEEGQPVGSMVLGALGVVPFASGEESWL
jgi:hypothetical protein